MAATPASGFLDRTAEREELARLLAPVREGQSGVLVIRGYGFEWMPAVVLVGALVLLMVPAFALIGLAEVALAAFAALVVLAGAILASPYLLARALRRRLAERHQSTRGSVLIARAIAQADPS